MKKLSRSLSMCLAVMFVFTCFLIPASAAGQGQFYYTMDGETHALSLTITDLDGNLLPTARTGYIPGYARGLLGDTNGNALSIPANRTVTAHIYFTSSVPLEVGYTLNGTEHFLLRDGGGRSTYVVSFETSQSGNYYFYMKNLSGNTVYISNAYVDIV